MYRTRSFTFSGLNHKRALIQFLRVGVLVSFFVCVKEDRGLRDKTYVGSSVFKFVKKLNQLRDFSEHVRPTIIQKKTPMLVTYPINDTFKILLKLKCANVLHNVIEKASLLEVDNSPVGRTNPVAVSVQCECNVLE